MVTAISCRLLLPLAVAVIAIGAVSGQERAPLTERLQQEFGLVSTTDGWWVLPQELDLREKLADLPKRRERVVLLERQVETDIERNAEAWKQVAPALDALRQSLRRLPTNAPEREAIERQIDALAATAHDPKQLGQQNEIRSQVIALAAERCALQSTLIWIRREWPRLREQYDQLAARPDFAEARKQLGGDQRLGPRRDYAGDLNRLGNYDRLVNTDWIPIYIQSGRFRVTALLGGELPVTFTWSDESDAAVQVTRSVIDAAGIDIPADAQFEEIAIGESRKVRAARIKLTELRIGKTVLRDVSALVLPPEAEDLGCTLPRSVLKGHSVQLEPERLRLWIDRKE